MTDKGKEKETDKMEVEGEEEDKSLTMEENSKKGKKNLPVDEVVVHPLVLLSVVDHYNRVAKNTKKRVVGVLLGSFEKGSVEVTNSYAVPFEEDDRNPNIWFLDHNYHENMFAMFKKVNAKEHVIGWYSTGPKIRANDIAINELMRKYIPHPVYVIIDVKPKELGFPTKAYLAVKEEKEDGTSSSLAPEFHHVRSIMGALEAEEVGVEHLLRDITDTAQSKLAGGIIGKTSAMKQLHEHLIDIKSYLEKVGSGNLPINHEILREVQDAVNLLPDLTATHVREAFAVKTNDALLGVYLGALSRSVIAIHDLIDNRLQSREVEKKMEEKFLKGKEEEEKKEKTEDETDKKGKEAVKK